MNFFESIPEIKNARQPDDKATIAIRIKISFPGTPRRDSTATAEPVLVFEIKKRARKEKAIVKTFIVPSMNKNSFFPSFEN